MIRVTRNKSLFFLLLLVSITQLYPDTNNTPSNLNSTFSLDNSEKPLSNNPVVSQCHQQADNVLLALNLLFNIKGSQLGILKNSIPTIISLCNNAQQISENAPPLEIYKTLVDLTTAITFIKKIMEEDLSTMGEFNPETLAPENVTEQEMEQVIEKINTNFNTLLTKLDEAYQDFLGTLLMHINNQLTKLDTILQTINTNLNNSNIVNKIDIKNDIKNLRSVLQQIKKEVISAGPNPSAILSIFQVNKTVINYLKEAQKYKFRKWAVIDLAGEMVRKKDLSQQSLEEIQWEMLGTNQELETLEKEAEKIDLNIVNKSARFMGDYIIDPIQKYGLDTWAVCLLLGGTYATYYFDDNFFTQPDSYFRKFFGFRNHNPKGEAPIDHHGNVVDLNTRKNKPMKWLGKIETFIFDQMHNITPIGLVLSVMVKSRFEEQLKDLKPLLTRKMIIWFNKLKGGSYAKTAEKYDIIYPTTTFDDIIGLEFEKSQVYPHLKYIKDPERWDANELTPVAGILLTGRTRSGKTFFAKAICGELHKQNPEKSIRFISIDAHDIKEQGIVTWLKLAKLVAPCVIFIDEIDLLGLQRNQDKTLLADFLQAMSGISDKDPKKQVIVIGTTNKPENIDTAMLQSGRFALEIRFKYPNMQERKEFIQKRLDKFAIDPEAFGIDIDKLARETDDKSFEDIKLMLDTALIHVGIKGQILSQDILEWSIDTQLRKIIEIDQKKISDEEKKLLAAHYAGQALSHILLNMNEKIAKITIRQVVVKVKEESVYEQYYNQTKQTGLDQGGFFTYFDYDTHDIKSTIELEKKAKTLLGARIAERIITTTCSTMFGWKKNSAFNMIKTIIADGIDLKSLSKKGQHTISDQTQAKLKEYEHEIETLLLQHKQELIALTNELQTKQTLSIKQIKEIIANVEQESAASTLPAMALAA